MLTLLPSVLAVGIAAFAGTTADYLLSKGMKLTQVCVSPSVRAKESPRLSKDP